MKYLISLVFLGLVAVGCQQQPQPNIIVNPTPQPQIQQPPRAEPPPVVPQVIPVIPVAPTVTFLKGYSDGYYGVWLAPARWVLRDEYRAGWSLGAYDRTHHLPSRYPR